MTGTVRELEVIQPKLEPRGKQMREPKGYAGRARSFEQMIEIPRACVTSYEIANLADVATASARTT